MTPPIARHMLVVNRKIFWLSFWVVGFAVFMTGLLLYIKYSNVFTGLQRERVLLVAGEIDDVAEKNLSLGQDFWEIATLQDVIVRRRTADPIFLSIEVAGKDGKIAYATDLARLGARLPAEWLTAFTAQEKLNNLSASPNEAVTASSIRNSFGQTAGYVVIRYDRQLEHQAMRAFTQRLVVTCLGLFVFFALFLYRLLAWIWKRSESELLLATKALLGGELTHPNAMAKELSAIQTQVSAATLQLGRVTSALAVHPEVKP